MNYLSLLLMLGVFGSCLGDYKRVCYFSGWAHYRHGQAKFQTKDVDTSLCTHLIYAFATLDDNATHLKAFDEGEDPDLYREFTDLKKQNSSLKTMLGVGGWTMGSKLFHKLVSSTGKIQTFAKNTVTFLRSHNFDGLDVDWEFPAARGSDAPDKHRFTQLLRILEQAFASEASKSGKPRLILSTALSPVPYRVHKAYEIPALVRYVDFINLMMYDFHGSWEESQLTGHHSALYGSSPDDKLNVDYLAAWWVKKGVEKSKLVIGVPLYGKTYQLNDTSNTGVGAKTSGPGAKGQYTKEEGTLAYHEICDLFTNAGATVHHLTNEKVPIMIDGQRWTGFDDVQSVREKAQYVVNHGFGGVMVWALDLDDFRGNCGDKYPLMRAITTVLTGPLVG